VRFVLIFGPPAVGKMTVGRQLCRRTGMRLFHNHAVLEPLLDVFDYGTPPFMKLLGEFRQRVIDEALDAGVDLIFTCVWGLDLDADAAVFGGYLDTAAARGARVAVVELTADLDTRLARNRTAERLRDKPSKRNVEWSDTNLRSVERYRLATSTDGARSGPGDEVIAGYPHLRLDTTALSAEDAAGAIASWLETEAG
jgi:hypothetical protein